MVLVHRWERQRALACEMQSRYLTAACAARTLARWRLAALALTAEAALAHTSARCESQRRSRALSLADLRSRTLARVLRCGDSAARERALRRWREAVLAITLDRTGARLMADGQAADDRCAALGGRVGALTDELEAEAASGEAAERCAGLEAALRESRHGLAAAKRARPAMLEREMASLRSERDELRGLVEQMGRKLELQTRRTSGAMQRVDNLHREAAAREARLASPRGQRARRRESAGGATHAWHEREPSEREPSEPLRPEGAEIMRAVDWDELPDTPGRAPEPQPPAYAAGKILRGAGPLAF